MACVGSGAGRMPSALANWMPGGEAVELAVGLGADQPLVLGVRDERRHAVVAQAAGVDARGHEVVAQRVHGDERRHADRVAVVVGVDAARQRRARGRLDGDDLDVGAGDLVAQERERDAGEVRAAAGAADHDVRALLAERGQLLLGLEADHGLVHEHVVEHGAERVGGLGIGGRALDRLGDREPQRAERVGIDLERGAAGVRHRATGWSGPSRRTSPSSRGGTASGGTRCRP